MRRPVGADHEPRPDISIARLRRTLLLLAANQGERQQVEAAGRHLAALGAAMRAEATTARRDGEGDGVGDG